jgi:hypothetical protein
MTRNKELCSVIVLAVIGFFNIAGGTAGSGGAISVFVAEGEPMTSESAHINPRVHFGLLHLCALLLTCSCGSSSAILELMFAGAEKAYVLESTEFRSALPPIKSFADRWVCLNDSWSASPWCDRTLDHGEMSGDKIPEVIVAKKCESIGPRDSDVNGSVKVEDSEVHRGIIQCCELGLDELLIFEKFRSSVGVDK